MFVPLTLGDLKFGIDALAFNSLKKTFGGTLSQQARIGGQPALHFTGRPPRKISLAGTLFPTRLLAEPETADGAAKIVGRSDLETLRAMAESGKSRWLVAGNGDVFGKFAIESLNEDESAWLEEGTPLRIDFTISLVEDLAEPGEENENSLAVLKLNAAAREARAKNFTETWKKYENEKTVQTVESIYAETPTPGKWYRTKQGDVLSVLCSQAYPNEAESDTLPRVIGENSALADTPQPFNAGTEIFFPAEANTQSTLTTSLFESTFLSRLV